jgi:hypothetical protein
MANIAFLGNFSLDFSSETHHAKTLESLGHKVTKIQEGQAYTRDILDAALVSDLFIWIHTHGIRSPGSFSFTMKDVLLELKRKNITSVTYHLDLWFGLNRQKDLLIDPVYKYIDHFFTVDSKMAEWFNTSTDVKGHYLPAGVYDKEVSYKKVNFKHDVIFVGSKTYHSEWPYRVQLIDWLEQTYTEQFELWGSDGKGPVRGNDLNRLYASTKIVVGDTLCPNFNYPDYWSDRVYETIGRGGFIIHPYINGMEKEFEDKKNIVFYEYGNFNQLKELIDYYLEHDAEREAIRLEGFKLVKNKYTYKTRWQEIMKEIQL